MGLPEAAAGDLGRPPSARHHEVGRSRLYRFVPGPGGLPARAAAAGSHREAGGLVPPVLQTARCLAAAPGAGPPRQRGAGESAAAGRGAPGELQGTEQQ